MSATEQALAFPRCGTGGQVEGVRLQHVLVPGRHLAGSFGDDPGILKVTMPVNTRCPASGKGCACWITTGETVKHAPQPPGGGADEPAGRHSSRGCAK